MLVNSYSKQNLISYIPIQNAMRSVNRKNRCMINSRLEMTLPPHLLGVMEAGVLLLLRCP